ncbi:MAG: type II secretion system protein GspM [Gemmatimonadota bacterium]
MESLLRFWSERAPREKAILAAGGIVVLATLIYLILIEPAWSGIARLERGLPATRAQAAQLQSLLGEVEALKARPQVATLSGSEVRETIDKTLATVGLKPTRIQALSESDIQLSFTDVPYAGWTSWLTVAERTLGARAHSVNATRVTKAGNADIEMVLRIARR